MPRFCQLADPDGYRAFDWDVMADPRDLPYWIGVFDSFPDNAERQLRAHNLTDDDFDARWTAFKSELLAGLDARRRDPRNFEPINTITLSHFRQGTLNRHGYPDPFVATKRHENKIAASLYPEHVRHIDALPGADRWPALIRGILAGNLFDLGAPKTIEMYNNGEVDFHAFLTKLKPRPWLIDHADTFITRLTGGTPYRKAMIFVDNAGADIVLGVIPFARELARNGTQVVLAANTGPALNDITIDELNPLLDELSTVDSALKTLLVNRGIETVGSGNGTPLIDLSQVTPECNALADDCDLVVLEGMGRGIESNWRQRFKCDSLRIALVKDECVVRWLNGELFDPIVRFERGVDA